MTTIPTLRKILDDARVNLQKYLIALAKLDPHTEFWQKQIIATLSVYPELTLQELHAFFVELGEETYQLPEAKSQPFASLQVALCLISLMEKKTLQKENEIDTVRILQQALYKPGQLIPITEDITPEKKDDIEIFEHDVTTLISTFTKITYLRYITEKIEEITVFLQEHPQITQTSLLSFNISWVENEFQKIQKIVDKPHQYAKFMIFPAMGGFAPLALTEEGENNFWQCLWQTHLLLPWKLRFGIGRLHARFYDQDYRVETYYASLPHHYQAKNLLITLAFHLCFWLQLCLSYHLFQSAYIQTITNNIRISFGYIKGGHPFFSALTIAFNLTTDTLKLLFSPIILSIPLILGITSIPLLCLRALIGIIPSYYLRTYSLILLDGLETLKDMILLIGGVLLLSPLIEAAFVLPSLLISLGGVVSTIVFLAALLAFTAIGLSPQILAVVLGIGGYNKIIDLAFSPLVSLGGIVGILSFPLFLAALTLPRLVVETAFSLQSILLRPKIGVRGEDLNFKLKQEYDPINELNLFVKKNPFLLQFEQIQQNQPISGRVSLEPSLTLKTPDKPLLLSP